MARILSDGEIRTLTARLSQNYVDNLRFGNTPPFPKVEDLEAAALLKNCDRKFSKVYEIDKFITEAGASGATIISLVTLGEQKRLNRLKNSVTELPLVVKKVNLDEDEELNEENYMDIVIGSRLNLLIASNIATGFMRTVDWFVCHDIVDERNSKSVLYTILEAMDSEMIKYVVVQAKANPLLLMSLLGQLLCNLESAQAAMGYVHYDLHTGNVMLHTTRRSELLLSDFWTFQRPNGQTAYISKDDCNAQEVKIIDFGRNRLNGPVFEKSGSRTAGASEVLVVSEMEDIGIGQKFHRQHDMRRYAMHFIEEALEQSEKRRPTTRRTARGRAKSIREGDFFSDLEDADAELYEQLMEVLTSMSGCRFMKTSQETRPSRERNEWMKRFAFIEGAAVSDSDDSPLYPDITVAEIDRVIVKFRDGGIPWLLKVGRAGKLHYFDYLANMWGWSDVEFPTTITEILDMPYFEMLYEEPSRSWKTAIATKYRPVTPQRESTKKHWKTTRGIRSIAESALPEMCTSCGSSTMRQRCSCTLVGYCSQKCIDEHWPLHLKVECPVEQQQ